MLQQLAQYGIEHIEMIRVPEDIPFERRHATKGRRRCGMCRLRQHEQPKRKRGLPKWKTFSNGLQGILGQDPCIMDDRKMEDSVANRKKFLEDEEGSAKRAATKYCDIVKKKNGVGDIVGIPFDDEAWAEVFNQEQQKMDVWSYKTSTNGNLEANRSSA
ncbi:hypothetical protein Tco_0140402 [Tanacetum coccineum]